MHRTCRFVAQVYTCYGGLLHISSHHPAIKPVSTNYSSIFSPSSYLPPPPTGPRVCCSTPTLTMCPCVLIIQLPLVSENMWYLVFCSCVSLLGIMASSSIHVPAKNMIFLSMAAQYFNGVYVLHFLYTVYYCWAFGLVLSLCYCEQCLNKHTCACIFTVELFIILWVYTQ